MSSQQCLTQLLDNYEKSVKAYLFGKFPLAAKRETARFFKEIEQLTCHDDAVVLCHERSLPYLQRLTQNSEMLPTA